MGSNVIHTCQICHKNVAWNSDDLTSHLKSHGYTSEKYKAEFMAAYRFNSEATLHMTDDSNWSDQNKFECKVEGCSEKLTSRVRLVLHIQKVHTLTALEYFREHKDSLTTDKYHKCQLCCAKKKVGGGKPKKKKKEEKKESITEDEVEVWATASLFCCQL